MTGRAPVVLSGAGLGRAVKNPTAGRDDGLGPISSEEYVKFRLLPTVRSLERKIPRTQSVYAFTQGVVLICTMLASVTAVVGLQAFIPAIISLVAAIESRDRSLGGSPAPSPTPSPVPGAASPPGE